MDKVPMSSPDLSQVTVAEILNSLAATYQLTMGANVPPQMYLLGVTIARDDELTDERVEHICTALQDVTIEQLNDIKSSVTVFVIGAKAIPLEEGGEWSLLQS